MKSIAVLLTGFAGAVHAAETHTSTSAGNLFQVLFGLVIVLALMAAAAWTLRRFGIAKSTTGTPVKIVGGISVGSRERILVIEVADQWIVVGVAPGRINTLSSMPRQQPATTEAVLSGASVSANGAEPGLPPPAKNFAAWLRQTIERRNGKQA
jgi:flagellar protein FliO/FliZ